MIIDDDNHDQSWWEKKRQCDLHVHLCIYKCWAFSYLFSILRFWMRVYCDGVFPFSGASILPCHFSSALINYKRNWNCKSRIKNGIAVHHDVCCCVCANVCGAWDNTYTGSTGETLCKRFVKKVIIYRLSKWFEN